MRRRDFFISLLGGAAATWPLMARAQQPAKPPTIGLLGTASASAWGPWTGAFAQRLRELGWIEGRTVAIEYRWAEGRPERFASIAAELVRLKVDVIVTSGAAGHAVKQATSVIPIVFAVANDPVGTGLVASLSRPGGNVTGLSLLAPDLAGKRLELLREIVPSLRRWQSWPTLAIPLPCWRWARLKQRPALLALKPLHWKFGERRTSRLHLASSRTTRKQYMSAPTHSLIPTGVASIPWRLPHGYRQRFLSASSSKQEV